MGLLANAGIDIFNTHKMTLSNALHVAVERNHYEVALMLISSRFPLNEKKEGGHTALLIASRDPGAMNVIDNIIRKGGDLDTVCDLGQTALAQSIIKENKDATELLLKHGAKLFVDDI